jgi:hypothetical protein
MLDLILFNLTYYPFSAEHGKQPSAERLSGDPYRMSQGMDGLSPGRRLLDFVNRSLRQCMDVIQPDNTEYNQLDTDYADYFFWSFSVVIQNLTL